MLRGLIYALLSILLITFIRGVVGILTKGVSDLFKEEQGGDSAGGGPSRPKEVSGELLKDPVCGTYVASTSTYRKTVAGKTHVFCSEKCRDQFAA
jgi:YHS domain-containing protein